MNIDERLRAGKIDASLLSAKYGYWKNVPTERLITENELNRKSDVLNSIFKDMEPLTCKCCGAPINRETMTCEYCGVQYRK